MLKRYLALLCTLPLIALGGCSASEYSNTISCDELSSVLDGVDDAEYKEYGEEYMAFFFEDTTLYNDFRVLYSTETEDINEVGFFHAKDSASARELKEELEEYLEEKQEEERAFIASYAPQELPKLDGAEVRAFGDYLVYAIMDASHRKELFNAIDARLKS